MKEPAVIHNTFVIERSYPKPPERVFSAFADPAKKRRWYAAGEHHEIEQFDLDFRVGGAERFRYRFTEGSPLPGMYINNEARYQDIVSNQRIVSASTMDLGEKRILASLLTIELLPTDKGTDLICTHQGTYLEWPDGAKLLEAGWRGLLDSLAAELG